MKLIRMIKTMAGPGGVTPAGKTRTVGDTEAAGLVAAGAAEIIGHISDQDAVDVLTPDASTSSATGQETAAVAGAPERAVAAKPAKKVSKK